MEFGAWRGGSTRMRLPAPASSLRYEPIAHEMLVQDLSCGEHPVRVELGQVPQDLACPPAWPRSAKLERRLEHRGLGGVWTRMRSVRTIE